MDALNHWVLHKFSSLDLLDPTSTYIYICTVVCIYIYIRLIIVDVLDICHVI